MKAHRTPLQYLDDILESMDRIQAFIAGLDRETFSKNLMAGDAVLRNLEVLGEAARNLPRDIRDAHDEIPWRRMIGLRNIVAHEYFGVDDEIIWRIVSSDLPPTRMAVVSLRDELEGLYL